MHHLQQKGVEKVIEFLKNINCKYKVVDAEGNVYTNITEDERLKKRAVSHYPFGELTAHVKKHVDHMKVGEVITIPPDKFDVDRIGSAASSYLSGKFGNGSYTTHRTKSGLEVLRMY